MFVSDMLKQRKGFGREDGVGLEGLAAVLLGR